ncbi:MAG TPA: hypothetical protein VI796_06460 [Candidatus Thermoplasmatota archaeon]|nr:hypothetical protein [Candidatus Thermoplasmatota archaeon]
MKRMAPRKAFLLLVVLTTLAWGVFAAHLGFTRHVSLPALANVLVFTSMLVAWPFLMGWRVHGGHLQHGVVCRDCGNPAWPGMDFGFCLRCGSARGFVRPTY